MGAGVQVTWLGLSADAGSFSTTGGLVLAVVSLVLGGVIYAVAYAARPGARRSRRHRGRAQPWRWAAADLYRRRTALPSRAG